MRHYQPIVAKPSQASQPNQASSPPGRSIPRPESPESPYAAGPLVRPPERLEPCATESPYEAGRVADSPRVLARIPNLEGEMVESGHDSGTAGARPGSRGSRLSLKILAGGVIVLLAVALKPLVWPLVSGHNAPTTAANDEPPRWPAPPSANPLAAPTLDARTSLPTTWQTGNVRAEPGQPDEPNSEEIPGLSTSPWDLPPNVAPSHDPMPWQTRAGQTAEESAGQYWPSYRTATRPQYAAQPRLPARPAEDRPDGTSVAPPGATYPQFTNPDVRRDTSPWRPPVDPSPGGRYREERPAPAYRDGLPLGSGDSTAHPGAARLEGYIENPNVRTSYERIGPGVY